MGMGEEEALEEEGEHILPLARQSGCRSVGRKLPKSSVVLWDIVEPALEDARLCTAESSSKDPPVLLPCSSMHTVFRICLTPGWPLL